MNADRQGLEQRNIQRRQEVIDLVSDNEDDDLYGDDDDVEVTPSPSGSSVSPPPLAEYQMRQLDPPLPVLVRQPAPNVPVNPPEAAARANNPAWQNVINLDEDLEQFQGFDDLDVRDGELERIMMEEYNHAPRPRASLPAIPPEMESKVDCVDKVVAVFPGICRDHVSNLFDTLSPTSDRLVAHILDRLDKGESYPSAREIQKSLKRKRNVDEDEEAVRRYGAVDRVVKIHGNIRALMRTLLSMEFPETPMVFIDVCLNQSANRLFSAYRVLEEAHRTFDPRLPTYNKMQKPRKVHPMYQEESMAQLIRSVSPNPDELEILQELRAARRIRDKANAKREAERLLEIAEEENIRKAERDGTMTECGCCYGDFPLNRMTHCDSEESLHWFCRGCARRSAEEEIGKSKYHLKCMCMDGCEAGFSPEQRSQFLDENTIIALERNEQEAVLRMAGIENLASCPFCPYAAEYPPVEENREFRCQAPECEKITCRLCKLESHIPKNCEEHAKENGLSIRRQIEEAMSAALIRKCNKCETPFVKEEGCNKMTCTRNGCFNIQCYVCSQSCGYDHFDDPRRGGKNGNCPLFESVEQRHEDEVKKAEKEAMDKVLADHPEYTADDLKVKMSEEVLKDEERRKAANPHAQIAGINAAMARHRRDNVAHFAGMRQRLAAEGHGLPEYQQQPGRRLGRYAGNEGWDDIQGVFGLMNDDAPFHGLWDHLPRPPGEYEDPGQIIFGNAGANNPQPPAQPQLDPLLRPVQLGDMFPVNVGLVPARAALAAAAAATVNGPNRELNVRQRRLARQDLLRNRDVQERAMNAAGVDAGVAPAPLVPGPFSEAPRLVNFRELQQRLAAERAANAANLGGPLAPAEVNRNDEQVRARVQQALAIQNPVAAPRLIPRRVAIPGVDQDPNTPEQPARRDVALQRLLEEPFRRPDNHAQGMRDERRRMMEQRLRLAALARERRGEGNP